ncbi:MAG: DUF134 domain-containing protein [Lentisphaeria bacterium]
MPRPRCPRQVAFSPPVVYFKPAGVPLRELEELAVRPDELESLRLADLEGLYQEEAAARMGISRPTFARLIESARRKVADALVNGRAIRLERAETAAEPPETVPAPPCRGNGGGGGCRRGGRPG